MGILGWQDHLTFVVGTASSDSRCASFSLAKYLVGYLQRKLKTLLTIIVKKTNYVILETNFAPLFLKTGDVYIYSKRILINPKR
jgi:hypothetical protein